MRITLLGTGAALSDPHRSTSMLAVQPAPPDAPAPGSPLWLVDCGADAAQRLMMAGGSLSTIHGLILTHEHIDHVCGFPLLMEKLWLSGRKEGLPIFGPAPAVDQALRIFDAFDTGSWRGMPGREPHPIDPDVDNGVLSAEAFSVRCCWARHGKPVIALRFESGTASCTYSADTEYSREVVELARGSDLLIHEATGDFPGHSSAVEAARVAQEAGARRLLLLHLPGESEAFRRDLNEARTIFAETEPGTELASYDLGD